MEGTCGKSCPFLGWRPHLYHYYHNAPHHSSHPLKVYAIMIIFVIHVIIIIIILIIMLLIIHCTITRDTFSYFIESPNAIIIMYIRRKHLLYHYLIIMLSSSHRNALHLLPNPLKVYAIKCNYHHLRDPQYHRPC